MRPHRERKSISVERTYGKDLPELPSCEHESSALVADLQGRIDANKSRERIDQCFVKVRFSDFTTTTVSSMGSQCTLADYTALIHAGWQRGAKPVRLLGLGVRLAPPAAVDQLALFTDSDSPFTDSEDAAAEGAPPDSNDASS